MKKFNTAALLMISAISASSLQAEVRHHDAHEHGKGQLNVALDQKTLFLELTLPGNDVIGFESISTKAQEEKVEKALTMLQSADLWSLSSAAQCSLTAAKASHSALSEGDHDHDDHDDDEHDKHASKEHHDDHDSHDKHEDEDHHDEHKKHAAKEHHDDDHHDHEEEGGHLEFTLTAEFTCKHPGKLETLTVNTFDHMPNNKSLSVQVLGNHGQKHATVTSDARKVAL